MIALCGQPFDQVTGMYTGAVRGHEITQSKLKCWNDLAFGADINIINVK